MAVEACVRVVVKQDEEIRAAVNRALTSYTGVQVMLTAPVVLSVLTWSVEGWPLKVQGEPCNWATVGWAHFRLPLPSMPYAILATDGRLFAGLADGQFWESHDRGDTWTPLRLEGDNLFAVLALALATDRERSV